MPKWLFLLGQISRQLWLRVAIYSALGVLTALLAVLLAPWVPEDFALSVGTRAVDDVLTILASSMLTVATFSLAVFVTAYTSISGAASPRAAALLVSDGRGHGALATFVGAFIFAIVGLFALQTGYYGEQGRVIVFVFTVGVLAAVLIALLHWIDQLSRLGRLDEAIDRVAEATRAAFDSPLAARRSATPRPENGPALPLSAGVVGYVRNIDLERLESLADELGVVVDVEALPGDFIHEARPLLRFAGRPGLDTEAGGRLRSCWVIGARRTFEQDPRFGMTVLGEIAARALSPAINDPGSALDVIATAVGLLTKWVGTESPVEPAEGSRLRLPPLSAQEVLEDVFGPIAQYGAGSPRVAMRLQEALGALAALGDPEMATAAHLHSRLARKRALAALPLKEDRERVRRAGRLSRSRLWE
ncbi:MULTISPECIES: DUF2254 domain-containing protein [unclassified Phenylobacterium]|uniref:DUF2254 domain-containing protein n=1 Tax=unclassified Phenylobacterium TaxID=2640670 RepID=UPI00083A3E5A|nr:MULTISPECIES: DUF2254 domain-containing protein [unclassified Phenylobacterium]